MIYPENKQLNLPQIAEEILNWWNENSVFEKSVSSREGCPTFTFYEGPPSANGLPGIHHVMARTIKDMFCRYKTLQGYQVHRKAGWDTHGLPVELGVEKELGITKEDIGKKISVEEYNRACRKAVMKYTDVWFDLTKKMGYWVNMDDPYVTYENTYIESVWYLLGLLYKKGLLYKGFTIQPYSPAAGTGLSSHELSMPGTYRNVKDTSVTAMFKVKNDEKAAQLFSPAGIAEAYLLAWTTTPWTLPSNTALSVGKNITYVAVSSFNPYTYEPVTLILAKDLLGRYFPEKNAGLDFESYKAGDKNIPFKVLASFKGSNLEGLRYEQLLPYASPDGDAFRVITGDFVTTEDGTGIVHTAPAFGSDDFKVARENGIGMLNLVDFSGRFTSDVNDEVWGFAGEFVKEQYLSEDEKAKELELQKSRLKSIIPSLDKYLSVDERIGLKLKLEGRAFKIEKFEHSYPHCWRTDKPVIYYPLNSWFIKTTAVKDRLIELNKTINWQPESTGTGRFGNWLENLQDWNLSRSRYWGIPIPIWTSEDGSEQTCISSLEQLKSEIEKSIAAGFMLENPLRNFEPGNTEKSNYESFDLHRPYADNIVLVSPTGKPMRRETDLIDVWFDSGAMPYAQNHYPFATGGPDLPPSGESFPADFIAEGVDQTRGWFFTLHAIAVMCFDSVAYKNVISNGLVLDKNGNKMSKRLGNSVDPFETLKKYGADATRWYMIGNAQPWDNLKFNEEGIVEVQRKFFGTLYNTYQFFALYANIDAFRYEEGKQSPVAQRTELDRWVLSKLNSLRKLCSECFDSYDPTPAVRAVEEFVNEQLSNWYVRLSRRRFWNPASLSNGNERSDDKRYAYETLYECLAGVAQMMSPVAPFFADWLYRNLNPGEADTSVHLSKWTPVKLENIDPDLENRMELAQKISSMVLSLRKKVNIRVRQPLSRIMVPLLTADTQRHLENVKELVLAETNVKAIEYLEPDNQIIRKKAKANFKKLGSKAGSSMKAIAAAIATLGQDDINLLQSQGKLQLMKGENPLWELELDDVEIVTEDIPGWTVASEGPYSVALDIHLDEVLIQEGLARELVNKIQNLRKNSGLEVTDRIKILVKNHPSLAGVIENNKNYICAETLGESLQIVSGDGLSGGFPVELTEEITTEIAIAKSN